MPASTPWDTAVAAVSSIVRGQRPAPRLRPIRLEATDHDEEEEGFRSALDEEDDGEMLVMKIRGEADGDDRRKRHVRLLVPVLAALAGSAIGAAAVLRYTNASALGATTSAQQVDYAHRVGDWSEKEVELRKYPGWGHHEPHTSLVELVAELDERTQATREWLKTTRSTSFGGTPIGLSSDAVPKRIRPAGPQKGRGPGKLRKGSPEKYGKLVQEWQTGYQTRTCQGLGEWAHRYAELHQGMLNGTIPPKVVQYRCELGKPCGGVADRLLGTVSAFTYAYLTNRAFQVSWEWPAPFDMVFDSPYIDWSTPYHLNETNNQLDFFKQSAFSAGPFAIEAVNHGPPDIDSILSRMYATDWDNRPWATFVANRGALLRSFRLPKASTELYNMGLQPDTAYSCVFDYLFRPKADVLNFLAQYTSVFSLPEVYTIAIQIRTGDTAMHKPETDLLNTVDRYKHYFVCADQVAQLRARQDQRVVYYLVSDSENLKKDALEKYPGKVVITGIGASHHLDDQDTQDVFGVVDGLQDAVADSWVQESADFQLITDDSGFGKIQSFRRGVPGTTINLARGGSPPDCSLHDSTISAYSLSQKWSLG